MDQLQHVEELGTFWLDGSQFEGLFELDHASLEVIQLGVDDAHHLIDLSDL